YHSLTHDEGDPQPQVDEVITTLMGCYADFLTSLRSIPEGDGTLLDSCVVLGTSEISEGRTHRIDDMPIVLAGSLQGHFKQDFHYHSASQENTSEVMLSLMRAMDLVVPSFGVDEAYATDSLTAIEV